MKRIISFAVSVLMVMTVFCGVLTVGSSAADATGKITFTSVAGPINEDGTFELKVYANDLTDYGFYVINTKLSFDTNIIDYNTRDQYVKRIPIKVLGEIDNAYNIVDAISGVSQIFAQSTNDGKKSLKYFEDDYESSRTTSIASVDDGASVPFAFNKDRIYDAVDGKFFTKEMADCFTYDEDGRCLYAIYYLKIKDMAATGKYDISVSLDYRYSKIATENSAFVLDKTCRTATADDCASVPATITLGSSTDITASVADSASIRLNADKDPTRCGLRFVGNIKVPEAKWNDVVDFGIAITDEHDNDPTKVNNEQVVLKIPAKVNTNGESLRKTDGSIDWTKAADATFSGVISSLKTTNYGRTFTAKVYYQLSDGTVVYSTGTIDRSVEQVYSSMVNDPTANQDAVAWVKDYFKDHMN